MKTLLAAILMTSILFQGNGLSAQTSSQGENLVRVELKLGTLQSSERTVTLEQVARVKTNDPQLESSLLAMDLDEFDKEADKSQAPTLVITKRLIEIRLRLLGIPKERIQVVGPDRVTIAFAAQASLTRPPQLEKDLQQQLAEQYAMPVDDIVVAVEPQFLARQPDIDLATLRLMPALGSELPVGRQTIPATAQSRSGVPQTVRIPVTIAMMRDLVLAKQNISKGESLGPDNITRVRRPVSNRSVKFASYEQVVGRQVQTDLQQYALLKSGIVRQGSTGTSPAVRKNSLVRVIVHRGPLKLTLMDAKALDNGNPGESIPFLNPKSEQRFMARVIDSSTAEIRF